MTKQELLHYIEKTAFENRFIGASLNASIDGDIVTKIDYLVFTNEEEDQVIKDPIQFLREAEEYDYKNDERFVITN